jgi:hypothetical protein
MEPVFNLACDGGTGRGWAWWWLVLAAQLRMIVYLEQEKAFEV